MTFNSFSVTGGFNVDVLTEQCFIAKCTFYHIFPGKSDFLYSAMNRKRDGLYQNGRRDI